MKRLAISSILVALALGGCVSQRDRNAGLAALKESPSMQLEIAKRCMERPVRLNPESSMDAQVINDLKVPESERMKAMCDRIVAALARGALSLDDMNQVSKGMFTPAMLQAFRTPAKLPVTPSGKPARSN